MTSGSLTQKFAGQKLDAFFISYGQPGGDVKLEDGHKFYRWVSIEPADSAFEPESPRFLTPRGPIGMAPYPQTLEPHFCEVQVQASLKDIIQRITLVHDSVGKHSTSLCTEIFGGAN